jgi:hypothetical protein
MVAWEFFYCVQKVKWEMEIKVASSVYTKICELYKPAFTYKKLPVLSMVTFQNDDYKLSHLFEIYFHTSIAVFYVKFSLVHYTFRSDNINAEF